MNEFQAIANLMRAQAVRDMAAERARIYARPIGTKALDIDFTTQREKSKPIEDYDFVAHGNHYKGRGARWSVWRVVWTGEDWRRTRRLTGASQYGDAITELREWCERLSLPRTHEV